MSSCSGYGRVLDIGCGNNSPSNNQNVQIWRGYDNKAQRWYIYEGGTTMSVALRPKANTNVALAVYGTSAGGTGTTSTSTGNVYMKTYVESDKYQQWYLEYVGQASPPARLSGSDSPWFWCAEKPSVYAGLRASPKLTLCFCNTFATR